MVNKANMKKLVSALRSGKYEQAESKLRDGNKFCCLGVACDISGLGKWTEKDGYSINKKTGIINALPKSVVDWLGLEKPDLLSTGVNSRNQATFDIRLDKTTAASMNDGGRSFKQIADALEKKFLKP